MDGLHATLFPYRLIGQQTLGVVDRVPCQHHDKHNE
jgi:hypothetical protein